MQSLRKLACARQCSAVANIICDGSWCLALKSGFRAASGSGREFYGRNSSYYDMRFVHGTSFQNLDSILEKGLMAKTLDIALCDAYPDDGVIPGMKAPPEILIVLDKNKLLAEGISMTKCDTDGVYKTQGQILQNGKWVTNSHGQLQGTIRPWFFRKILDNRPGTTNGNVLFLSKDAWEETEEQGKRSDALPDRLIHATDVTNLSNIWTKGILPHDRLDSSNHKLKGAENHVNAVLPPDDGRKRINVAGIDKVPDVLLSIDVKKARELGIVVRQSPDRPDHYLICGELPPECLSGVHANSAGAIPKHLEAKVVSPSESFETLPIIDLRKDESELIELMRYACSVPGFFQVVGHDVPEDLETKFLDMQKQLFDLPAAQKEAFKTSDDSPVRGYFGRGAENLDGVVFGDAGERVQKIKDAKVQQDATEKLMDNKEGFDMNGVPWSKPGEGEIARVFGLQTRFPEHELPELRSTVEGLSAELFKLAKKLLRLMAMALDLEPNFFDKVLTAPVATHRMIHYWPLEGDFDRQIGIGEHTDYGFVTILKQDDVGGLQVLSALDMQWVMVPPISGAYVVNLGDMLSIWTGNYFKSTIHRVVNTSDRHRYSAPFFLEPNLDTVIKKGELRPQDPAKTAEQILEGFYVAAGLLKPKPRV